MFNNGGKVNESGKIIQGNAMQILKTKFTNILTLHEKLFKMSGEMHRVQNSAHNSFPILHWEGI